MTNPKAQYGVKKPPLSLVPSSAMIELATAMLLGAKKYGPANWRVEPVSASIYIDAAERHLRCWLDGEDTDPESGASHLGHVMACCAILIDAGSCGALLDDRPPQGRFADLVREFVARVDRGEIPPLGGE